MAMLCWCASVITRLLLDRDMTSIISIFSRALRGRWRLPKTRNMYGFDLLGKIPIRAYRWYMGKSMGCTTDSATRIARTGLGRRVSTLYPEYLHLPHKR